MERLGGEPEHEIGREAIQVALDLLVEPPDFHAVEVAAQGGDAQRDALHRRHWRRRRRAHRRQISSLCMCTTAAVMACAAVLRPAATRPPTATYETRVMRQETFLSDPADLGPHRQPDPLLPWIAACPTANQLPPQPTARSRAGCANPCHPCLPPPSSSGDMYRISRTCAATRRGVPPPISLRSADPGGPPRKDHPFLVPSKSPTCARGSAITSGSSAPGGPSR